VGVYDDPPERVRAAWDALQDTWGEPARHDAFLALASETDTFPWAARQYRGRAGDPVADERLARIQKAAVARMAVMAPPRVEKAKKHTMLVVMLVLLVATVVIGMMLVNSLPQRGRQPEPSPPPAGLR
jgi:hypothetical protein